MRSFVTCLLCLALCGAAQAQSHLNVERIGQILGAGGREVVVSGNYAYVVDGTSGLRIIEITNPAAPVQVGLYNTPGIAYGVAVRDSLAYVADDYTGLRIINISNPAAPVQIGFYDDAFASHGVVVSGHYAYVASYIGGLRILNISNPLAPSFVGARDTPDWAQRLALQDNYAYVGDGNSGLRIINVANPAAPVETGFCDTPGAVRGVALNGNYAYVGDNDGGLRVIGISNPAAPTLWGACTFPNYAQGVAVHGNFVYVAATSCGLRVVDVSDPAAPVQTGYFDTPGVARGVAYANGLAYLVDDTHFGIYDCSASTEDEPPRGTVQLIYNGPSNWGYRLVHLEGSIDRLAFTDFCLGTTGSVSDGAASWTVMANGDGNDGDSIVFYSAEPLVYGTLETFWLSHPSCIGDVRWCAGDSCGTVEGPLPLEFLGLTAASGDGEVTLIWRTASEQNNDRFEIERNGELAASIPGQGNSSSERRYEWTDSGLSNGRTYHYTLFSVSTSGERTELQSIEATPATDAVVAEYALHDVYPNPFNATTQIRFDVPHASFVNVAVYDLQGRLLETLASRMFEAGRHTIAYDASPCPSGTYIVRMQSGEFSAAQKVVLMK